MRPFNDEWKNIPLPLRKEELVPYLFMFILFCRYEPSLTYVMCRLLYLLCRPR